MFNYFRSLLKQLKPKSLEELKVEVQQTFMVHNGISISKDEAENLETNLQNNSSDIRSRALLIGYYSSKRFEDENCIGAWEKHVLWVIENIPGHRLASESETHFFKDDSAYKAGKELWIKHVESNKKDLAILENAAGYLLLNDKELAEEYLLAAKKIDPLNPKWLNKLSFLYKLEGRESVECRKKAFERKIAAYQLARKFSFSNAIDELIDLPELARDAGDSNQATIYANKLLKKAESIKDESKNARCIHEAKHALGLVAFDKEDFDLAGKLLLESLATSSDARRYMQTRFKLAKLLMNEGYTSKVGSYVYRLTDRFEAEKIQSWQLEIKSGKIPEDWKYKDP